jgi:hypothetical protein
VPLANPDFAPFSQRARDLNPDALFVFVPASQAGTFAKQFVERGSINLGFDPTTSEKYIGRPRLKNSRKPCSNLRPG